MMVAVFMNQLKSESNSGRNQVSSSDDVPLLANQAGPGNMQMIQQVFEGAFEVSLAL
jgi:hypothetical protein